MTTIKIEIPSDDAFAANIMGNALLELAKRYDTMAPVTEHKAPAPKTEPTSASKPRSTWTPDDRDAEFLPWDKRIHSTNHGKVADGTWRIVRRPKIFDQETDPEGAWTAYIETVKAELIAARDGDTVQEEAPITTQVEEAPITTQVEEAPITTQVEEAPITTFGDLMVMITGNIELITINDVNELCAEHGLTGVNDLAAGHDDLIPVIAEEIRAIIHNV
jgi:hypothetical protein